METPRNNGSKLTKSILPVSVAALIVFAAIGFYIYRQNNSNDVAVSPLREMMSNQNQMGQKMMQARQKV